MPAGRPDTLGAALASRRRRAFVGRSSEIELFEAALDAGPLSLFSVLYVSGPGGIGKSSLLDVCADLASERGAAVVRIDGRAVSDRRAVHDALSGLDSSPRPVVLIDSYERLASLDPWVRSELLPGLPAGALVVIAGRTPPPAAWRADPAWRELLRIVSLRNLTPDEARAYLAATGVDVGRHEELVSASHGHPLALSLLADLVRRGADAQTDPLTPDLVATLVRRFVDIVPTTMHRRALEVCALARLTTEALLREALGIDDAHDLFAWLRGLSFIETRTGGLMPHDLARDVLDIDLRWRDPDAYEDVFRRVRRHIHRRLATLTGLDQQRAIADEKFVFRNLPSVLSPVDWDAWGEHYPEPAQPGDLPAIITMVRDAEGPSSATIAEQWWARQPSAFFVVRDAGSAVRGFLALVDLQLEGGDLSFDPGARAAWDFAARTAPPRSGESVTQTRFVVDRKAYQAPSPTLNAAPILTMQRYLGDTNLAWDFLTLADPDPLNQYFALADLPRAAGADFTVDGRTYGLFAHDFRRVPVDAWLEVVTDRALRQDVTLPTPSADTLVLSQPDFADAVRQALRDLRSPDLLARNPLIRTRLVTGAAAGPDRQHGATLAALLADAVETLRSHPRDDKRWRALDRTYLRPAATQELAAEVLGLPFSTYRRHLTEGLARVTSYLWDLELHGPVPDASTPTEQD